MKFYFYIFLISIIVFSCVGDKTISIQEKMQKDAQYFFIDASRDTIITGLEGTMIFIEKGSFRNAIGKTIKDSVVVSLKEFYKNADIIMSDLNMRAGNKLLETGGMIELRAYGKGNQLSLNRGKSVVVHFPKPESKNDSMRLFYENKSEAIANSNQGGFDWELEESSVPRKENEIHPWYTKYEGIDNQHLYLSDSTIWYDTLPGIFNFNKKEIDYFINKTVKVHYDVKKSGNLVYDEIDGSIISRKMEKRLAKVAKNFPKCKPYTIAGKAIDMPGWFQIWTEIKAPKYMSNEAYLKQMENKFQTGDSTGIDINDLQYYIFDSKQLGWMNCDQFINPNPISTNFRIKVPKSENIFVKIIFKNYKTVMIGNEEPEYFTFEDLPLDEPITIVVIDEEDGKVLFKIEDTKISKEVFEIKNLNKGALKEIQKALSFLN